MSEFRPYGLFYDVISGEFTDPTKKDVTAHTLARLAVAACRKGDGPIHDRTYRPSWAPETSISVHQPLFKSKKDGQLFLNRGDETTIILNGGDEDCPSAVVLSDLVTINSRLQPAKHHLLISENGKFTGRIPLELESDLGHIRDVVATVAQDFCNRNA